MTEILHMLHEVSFLTVFCRDKMIKTAYMAVLARCSDLNEKHVHNLLHKLLTTNETCIG